MLLSYKPVGHFEFKPLLATHILSPRLLPSPLFENQKTMSDKETLNFGPPSLSGKLILFFFF